MAAMNVAALAQRFSHLLGRFARDRDGMSAVEFAMLLPLMMTLYLGTVEISQGISINRKVTLTTRTLADLTSQSTTIGDTDMTNILNATAAVVSPYATANLKATVSLLSIDSTGKATVSWSNTLNGTARAKGQVVTLAAALAVPSTSLVLSEVQYNYTPTIGYVITGSLTLKDQMYMRPRQSDTITRTSP